MRPRVELGEDLGIAFTVDQGGEHGPRRLALDVGGDARQLHPGVLEHLVQALGLPAAFFDLGLAVAGVVAQLPDRFGRHERRSHQAVLDELADPFGVTYVGLASRDVAQMAGVEQPALDVVLWPTATRPTERAAIRTGGNSTASSSTGCWSSRCQPCQR
jgi:hypothetical protein